MKASDPERGLTVGQSDSASRHGWCGGLIAIAAGVLLLHFMHNQPASRFPLGRWPVYCFCDVMIVAGVAILYGYAVSRRWLAKEPFLNTVFLATCLTFFTAILVAWLLAPDASTRISAGIVSFKTNSATGRLIVIPIVLFFGGFSLLAWATAGKEFMRRQKTTPDE